MATAVIVDAVRTPGGKRYGKLSGWHAADLAYFTRASLGQMQHILITCIEPISATAESRACADAQSHHRAVEVA